jgi:raffinose/stachyose/melibiose transport system permease protein
MLLKGTKKFFTLLLFAAPGLILYGFIVLYQITQGIGMSFYTWPTITTMKFAGLENYFRMINNQYFWKSLFHTFLYMFGTSSLQLIIGFTIGYLLYFMLPGYRFFRVILFVPAVLASVAVGFVWQYIYSPAFGLLKPVMQLFGLGHYYIPPLASENLALLSIIFAQTWASVGVQIMMYNAAFMRIPPDVIEAAIVDGISGFGMIRHMIFPLSLDVGKVIIILQVIGSLRAFDLVFIMTKGGPNHSTELLAMSVYQTAFERFKFGEGNAIAVFIFLLCLAATVLLQRLLKTNENL